MGESLYHLPAGKQTVGSYVHCWQSRGDSMAYGLIWSKLSSTLSSSNVFFEATGLSGTQHRPPEARLLQAIEGKTAILPFGMPSTWYVAPSVCKGAYTAGLLVRLLHVNGSKQNSSSTALLKSFSKLALALFPNGRSLLFSRSPFFFFQSFSSSLPYSRLHLLASRNDQTSSFLSSREGC